MDNCLLTDTLLLLRRNPSPISAIAQATGLKTRWLHRLKAGDFEDPGVTKIERLHRYLVTQDKGDEVAA